MIIASAQDPVYAADGYFDLLDPQAGFVYGREEPLNELVTRRFFETWSNPEFHGDRRRRERSYAFLSTISERVMPYRPSKIEPSILTRRYHPFKFSYNVISDVSDLHESEWRQLRELSSDERQTLSGYLQVPLDGAMKARFEGFAGDITGGRKLTYFQRIQAILQSYSTCQYEIGFTDDVSVDHMEEFLFDTRTGDCTEFSNSAAILARLLDIPSRVVTGYLGSQSLQTTSHKRGLSMLQQAIEPLQEYSLDELFLITTAHRHSWTQFYLPNYGWVDFDATSYGIPPASGFDANAMDVVIPIIDIEEISETNFAFPWRFALRVFLILFAVAIFGLYFYRYGRELAYRILARGTDRRALQALCTLLFMKMAINGYELKAHSQTAVEYATRYPEIQPFAELYTTLRYREVYGHGEQERFWDEIRGRYRNQARLVRKVGLIHSIRRFISLRGLFY